MRVCVYVHTCMRVCAHSCTCVRTCVRLINLLCFLCSASTGVIRDLKNKEEYRATFPSVYARCANLCWFFFVFYFAVVLTDLIANKGKKCAVCLKWITILHQLDNRLLDYPLYLHMMSTCARGASVIWPVWELSKFALRNNRGADHVMITCRLFAIFYSVPFLTRIYSDLFRSILTRPWMELGGKVTITSPTTGFSANLEFHCKVGLCAELPSSCALCILPLTFILFPWSVVRVGASASTVLSFLLV